MNFYSTMYYLIFYIFKVFISSSNNFSFVFTFSTYSWPLSYFYYSYIILVNSYCKGFSLFYKIIFNWESISFCKSSLYLFYQLVLSISTKLRRYNRSASLIYLSRPTVSKQTTNYLKLKSNYSSLGLGKASSYF